MFAFFGDGDEAENSVIELTYNYGKRGYSRGTGYGHIAFGVEDIHAARDRLASLGVKITRRVR